MSRSRVEARYLEGVRGRLFVVLREPAGRRGGACVLLVPPFAEELNKSRRMLTELALSLADRGIATVMPDLYGTGDSEGEFRDADWEVWTRDLLVAASWASSRDWSVRSMLAIRLGCPLGADAAALLPEPLERCVYWQPVADGQRFTTQFLRLRVAASMMADQKETVSELRERIDAGECIEVAGYECPPRLFAAIDRLTPDRVAHQRLGRLHWIELVRDKASSPSAASMRTVEASRTRVPALEFETAVGEPFWAATEIVVIPDLVARTTELLAAAA